MKQFDIPQFYRSPVISRIKNARRNDDPRKKDFTPTKLDFGPVRFLIARHFGFCYGVENAIEIAYKTINENPGKRIYLLSEMIHNPGVNNDLIERGVKFLMDTSGNHVIDWNTLNSEDIVIIPAFGTTVEIGKQLAEIGIDPYRYNTTCPFVEKVWNRSAQLGANDYTIVIHGKHYHEETRATFSHTINGTASVIVRDIDESKFLADVITGVRSEDEFYSFFAGKYSKGFDVKTDLLKIAVVNQTTMLASETEAISLMLRNAMVKMYGFEKITEHFADTRDTLCYATNDNQEATYGLLREKADLAIVVGGYNSSNTSHIVELCEAKLKTYFISSEEKIVSDKLIKHFNLHSGKEILTENFLSPAGQLDIILTSGASCPDSVVDQVLHKILSFYTNARKSEDVVEEFLAAQETYKK